MKEKILIIEDDFTIQTQLKTLLSGNGYEVFAVTDFSQTIEQLKEAAPHLVILDIKRKRPIRGCIEISGCCM